MKAVIWFFLVFICVLCGACSPSEIIDVKLITAGNLKKHKGDTILIDSISHQPFSRITKPKSSGLYYEYKVPEDLQNKHFYIVFSGRVRSNIPQTNATIVLMAFDKHKQQLCWMALPFRPFIVRQNEWNTFRDSIHIPNVMNDVIYTSLKAFPYSGDVSHEILDIDTFSVTLKRTEGSNRFR